MGVRSQGGSKRKTFFLGEMILQMMPSRRPIIGKEIFLLPMKLKTVLSVWLQWGLLPPILMAYMTWQEMSGNGVKIGIMQSTMLVRHPIASSIILKDLLRVLTLINPVMRKKLCEVALSFVMIVIAQVIE